jgi:hypothetical protein
MYYFTGKRPKGKNPFFEEGGEDTVFFLLRERKAMNSLAAKLFAP